MSLPGAGETEPTILEELNRTYVNQLLNQQQEQEPQQQPQPIQAELKSDLPEQESQVIGKFVGQTDKTICSTDSFCSDNNRNISDHCRDENDDDTFINTVVDAIRKNEINVVSDIHNTSGQTQSFLEYENKSENSGGDHTSVVQQGQIASDSNSSSSSCGGDTTATTTTPSLIAIADATAKSPNEKQRNLCDFVDKCEYEKWIFLQKLDNLSAPETNGTAEHNYRNELEEILNFELQTVPFDSELSASFTSAIDTNTIDRLATTTTATDISTNTNDNNSPVATSESSNFSVQNVGIGASQSLIKYRLSNERELSPPPVPLSTYRWEDVRRAKEKVGCLECTCTILDI